MAQELKKRSPTDFTNKKWVNQYIKLASSKPNLLYPFLDGAPTENDTEWIRLLVAKARAAGQQIAVELGSGSGGFIIEFARQNPNVLCFALELRFKRAYRTAEKAEPLGINNLKVLRTDARALAQLFEPETIDQVIVNFPDPWSKRRWLKHRLLSPELIHTVATVLTLEGRLCYKTDHREYFDATLAILNENPVFQVTKKCYDLNNSEFVIGNIKTEFEQLFNSQDKPICMLEACKLPIIE